MTVTTDWSCPDGELVLSVEDAKDRERWLAERRKGIGGSEIAALMGEGKYVTPYDIWLDKTGRSAERERTIQMEMGMRMEAAIAEKFSDDYGIEVRRRGMLRSKAHPVLLFNADRLAADGYGLECKAVNQFIKMPTDLSYRAGMRSDWYWQCVAGLLVTGRVGWYLAVGIGNSDFQVRSINRADPQVQEDMRSILEVAPRWWFEHVVADQAPEFTGMPDLSEVREGATYEAIIPGLLLEQRDRLREIRELRRDLKEEEDALKKDLEAEAGGAEWLLADGRAVLHLNPTRGRSSFQKADLFKRQPIDGQALAQWAGYDTVEQWLAGLAETDTEQVDLTRHLLTEAQFTKTGPPGKALLIVGAQEED